MTYHENNCSIRLHEDLESPFLKVDVLISCSLFLSIFSKFICYVINTSITYIGPDHVQVFWKHKSIGNQAFDWLTR